jgi:hypothetical protein
LCMCLCVLYIMVFFGLLFPFLPLVVVQTLPGPRCLLFRRYVISSSFYLLVRTLSFHYILVMKFGRGPWWKMLINARKMRFFIFWFFQKIYDQFQILHNHTTTAISHGGWGQTPYDTAVKGATVFHPLCGTTVVNSVPCGTVAPPIVVPHDVGFSSFKKIVTFLYGLGWR